MVALFNPKLKGTDRVYSTGIINWYHLYTVSTDAWADNSYGYNIVLLSWAPYHYSNIAETNRKEHIFRKFIYDIDTCPQF